MSGVAIFFLTSGFGGISQAGFLPPLALGLPIWLGICAAGGALGGFLMGRDRPLAGALGGLIAGPCGLVAVYYYAQLRKSLLMIEIALVQGLASLPGLFVYRLIKKLSAPRPPESKG